MKPSSQNQYTAWIDGLLSPGENALFEAALPPQALEAARQERAENEKLGALLRTHLKAPAMPNADFFTHAILQEIGTGAPSASGASATSAATPAPFASGILPDDTARFSWGFLWRLLSASAACAVISILFFISLTAPREGAPYYAEFVNPLPAQGISAASFGSCDENSMTITRDLSMR